MRLARDFIAAATPQEIQVCTRIRLHYPLHIELLIAAFHRVHRRLPPRAPLLQLFLRNIEVDAPGFHV
jgi:hypothetical protein